jgi:hypothetical protein
MMRGQAIDNLAAARAILDDAAHHLEALQGDMEPADGVEDEAAEGPSDESPGSDDATGPEEPDEDDGERAAGDGRESGGDAFPRGLGGPCVLATVAMGTPLASDLEILRGIRDRYLMTNAPGRGVVATYYCLSPPMARAVAKHENLRQAGQMVLAPIIRSVKHPWEERKRDHLACR